MILLFFWRIEKRYISKMRVRVMLLLQELRLNVIGHLEVSRCGELRLEDDPCRYRWAS